MSGKTKPTGEGGLDEGAGQASSASSLPRPNPLRLRARLAELVWTGAIGNLPPDWLTLPEILDLLGKLDLAIEHWTAGGDREELEEAMAALNWVKRHAQRVTP